MNRTARLFAAFTLASIAAASCGGTPDDPGSPTSGSAGRAGSSHSGSGGTTAGRSGSSTGAEGGTGDDAGSGGASPGVGGKAGNGGKTGSGGAKARGSRGGNAGRGGASAGTPGSVTAGEGGAGGSRDCIGVSAIKWYYLPQPGYQGVVGTYGTELRASGIAESDAIMALSLLLPDTGKFTLGIEDDTNLATCKRCLMAKLYNIDGADHDFFADAGELDISPASDTIHGVIHASLAGGHLYEVTIDEDTGVTTAVPGGLCIDVADGRIDVDPSVPDPGEGGAGGGGNEGGAANGGNEGGAGGEIQLPTHCIEVATSTWTGVQQVGDYAYRSFLTPNLGSADRDTTGLLVFSNDVGTFTFGKGPERTFNTCEHCLLARVPDPAGGTDFMAMGGTLDIASTSVPLSGVLAATLSDVTLMQTDVNMLPIAGGQCLHLASASISVP